MGSQNRKCLNALLGAAAGAALLAPGRPARAGAPPQNAENQLVTGKLITPSGQQTPLGSVPLNAVMNPGGQYLVTTSNGFLQYLHVISAVDGSVRDSAPFQVFSDSPPQPGVYDPTGGLYYGLVFSPDGKTLYASGGSYNQIYVYRFANGQLIANGTIANPRPMGDKFDNFTAGLAISGDGKQLFAANNYTDTLSIIDTAKRTVTAQVPVPAYPYAVAATSDGSKVYVASQRDNVVAVVSPRTQKVAQMIAVGDHPDALLLDGPQRRLFVANAQSDTVSVVNTGTDQVTETINLRPAPAQGLPGATATGLALSPSGKTLYVTLADMNAVAVVHLASPNSSVQGYIPTGWYPTAVAVSPDGQRLFVTNAKGTDPRNPNPQGEDPYSGNSSQYVYYLLTGTLSMIPVPTVEQLADATDQVLTNNNLLQLMPAADELKAGGPIQHIIYIIKENRTYDQILGDLPQGNGDPTLTLFGPDVTPNQHKLASTWALLDNFYDCGEVSGVGWNWSNASYANEFAEKTNPYQYAGRQGNAPTYDYEGENRGVNTAGAKIRDVAEGANGYIWDLVKAKGLSYRNYGFFLNFGDPKSTDPATMDNFPTKAALIDHTDLNFRRFDMAVPDQDRFTEWKKEFDQFVANKNLPNFLMVRFPRDHTAGTTPGMSTPQAMVADNDMAVGKLVEAVSHSPYWGSTAIFILEDDAQNGPDHVDAHRSTCYVVSPYVKRGVVDSRFYNTDSVLKSMELLLGLPPLSQYDATAPSLKNLFTDQPDMTPFDAVVPTVNIADKNTKNAFGAAESLKMAFDREDRAPADRLNRILWHAIKGKHVPYPKIRHNLKLAQGPERGDVD